jgi:hypothetical protein
VKAAGGGTRRDRDEQSSKAERERERERGRATPFEDVPLRLGMESYALLASGRTSTVVPLKILYEDLYKLARGPEWFVEFKRSLSVQDY